ncbi:MAG: DMT family transporter [Brucella sp.]
MLVRSNLEARPLMGIALASLGYACFALQDAVVKWLVADYAVTQILFVRSIVVVAITGLLAFHFRHPSIMKSRYKGTLVLRAALMLVAWLLFYSAARHLGLAEVTTLYFSAPLIIMFLSIFILKERVGRARWVACLGGFGGVVVAANPTESPTLMPALMCLAAAFCWALSTILIRLVSRTETTLTQMYATSLLFGFACAITLPWLWKDPDVTGWLLMLAVGLVATIGQYLLYEGFRYAPASALATTEYTALIWAFLYGYAIWMEVPGTHVFIGALMIVTFSLALVGWERRSEHTKSSEVA